jgi:D-alanyl-D-alanine carboxypeptidase/D-alanyl-D-alanine-endopeptidase (penicillin-binding protein 4)
MKDFPFRHFPVYVISSKILRMGFHKRVGLFVVVGCLSFSGLSFAVDRGFASGLAQVQPTPTPRPRVVSTPLGSPTASPIPSPSPFVTPRAIQTLEDLQSKIRQRMFAPEVRRGRVGIKIVSLASGKVIFENDADKYFMPASNMKNFTVATALERLGPDFRFVTSVFANAMPDSSGTIKGDVRIFGRGDVSISTAFFGTSPNDPETYYKGIDRLVDRISAAGVKRIEGGIVGDESFFKGFAIPVTWEWDDLQWYYGAEISALSINDNAVDLAVMPGTVGGPCIVTISPANTLFQITNTCTTTAESVKRNLTVNKRIDRNVLEISGTMPIGESGFKSPIAVTHPADLFVAMLKRRLEATGITVTGNARTLPPNVKIDSPQVEVAKLESPPFSLVAAKTMKPSQNMFTETILWTLGEQSRLSAVSTSSGPVNDLIPDSSILGINVVKGFMKQIGVPDDGIIQHDGSGLSRHDLITPNAIITLYTYMAKESKNAQVWRDSLTIGGVDGTLARRFLGTSAAGNMRGKTGTIDQVSALSGYVKTAAGEELVVSFVVNGVALTSHRTSLMDDIVVSLANFNGRID